MQPCFLAFLWVSQHTETEPHDLVGRPSSFDRRFQEKPGESTHDEGEGTAGVFPMCAKLGGRVPIMTLRLE